MFVTLKSLLRTLILPPAGPLLAAFAAIWLLRAKSSPRARRAGWTLLVAGMGSLWLLSMPIVAGVLARAAQRTPTLDLERPIRAQAIVILAGSKARAAAPEYGGAPAADGGLLERLTYGAYLAHRTGLPVLITGTPTEAQAMRATLARDFAVQVRWVESHSRDTFDNAQLSAAILRAQGITTVLLVMMYAQTRVFYCMSRDGLIPPSFTRLHPRWRTPMFSQIFFGVLIAAAGALFPIGILGSLTNMGTLIAFVLVSVAVPALRKLHPQLRGSFTVPFGPYIIPVLSAVTALFLIYFLKEGNPLVWGFFPLVWLGFLVWLVVGLLFYFSWGRQHSTVSLSANSAS